MEISINLPELEELDLNPSLYCYLFCLYYDKPYNLADEGTIEYMNHWLEENGWLKQVDDGVMLREECGKLFKKGTPTDESVTEWIQEWRELFPKGVKSGNRPVRGDKQGVISKMKAFVKKHKDFSKEEIFEATKTYVFDASLKSYNYMICADYFIIKNGSSMLAAMIEDIRERGSTIKTIEEGGGSAWHKEI